MAEMFGVIGSAVGVAGFAFQIADGINKLVDFCQAVKDAPEDLRNAIFELRDLGELYKEIGRQIDAQQQTNVASLPSKAVLDRILARCERNHSNLQSLLSEMDDYVKSRSTRGSIKAVLKKDTFLKFQRRVETSKTSLQLSYTFYWNELARQETISMRKELQKISAVTPHITAMGPQIDILVNQALGTRASTPCPVNSIQKQQTPQAIAYHFTQTSRQTTRLTLRLPRWLSCRTYDLAFNRSICGWNVSLQTYNIVPLNTEFFIACRAGDVQKVKDMLISEPSHVLDRSPYGWTALHDVADSDDRAEMLQLLDVLLFHGADRYARSDFGESCVEHLVKPRTCVVEVFHSDHGKPLVQPKYLHLEKEDFERYHDVFGMSRFAEMKEENPHIFNEFAGWIDSTSPFKDLVMQHMDPPWHTRSLADRIRCLADRLFRRANYTSKEQIEDLQGVEFTQYEWKADENTDRSVVIIIMENYGRAVRGQDSVDILEWRGTLRQAVLNGVNLFEIYSKTSMSLCWSIYSFLEGFSGYNEADSCHGITFQVAVTSLAEELQELGFDLLDIGPHIQKVIQRIVLEVCIFKGPNGSWWYMPELQYGPELKRWYIEYLDASIAALEGLADFWDFVESPKIPGAWPEEAEPSLAEEGYFEACGRVVLTMLCIDPGVELVEVDWSED